jgi:hypothetical protein
MSSGTLTWAVLTSIPYVPVGMGEYYKPTRADANRAIDYLQKRGSISIKEGIVVLAQHLKREYSED